MSDQRTLNLLGAFALGITDVLENVVEKNAGYGGETPAALVTIGAEPGLSINKLHQILNLSHPGTVRLVDRLEVEGLVERRAGSDGRTLALFLTSEGVKRRKTVLSERQKQLDVAMKALSKEERKQLTKLLEKMLTAMTTTELRSFTICRLCEDEVCPAKTCPVEQRYVELSRE